MFPRLNEATHENLVSIGPVALEEMFESVNGRYVYGKLFRRSRASNSDLAQIRIRLRFYACPGYLQVQ